MPRTAARRYRHFQPATQELPRPDATSSVTTRSKTSSLQPRVSAEPPPLPSHKALHLPAEILLHILSFIPHGFASQATLASFCLVSRAWYAAAVPRLYEKPYIHGRNYDPFVRTICPSINAHVRKSELAELVKVLDLGNLVHHGSKSVTARLLGRTKANLHTFVAPQASFGLSCLAALSKCQQLRILDLGLTSESIGLRELAHALSQLRNLTTFTFPRCSLGSADSYPDRISWPPRLVALTLSGGVDDRFIWSLALEEACKLPPSLRKLSLTHCPSLHRNPILELLRSLSTQLTTFHVTNIPRLSVGDLDGLLVQLPKLLDLTISLDYMSCAFFPDGPESGLPKPQTPYPLQILTLVSSGNQVHPYQAFTSESLWTAVDGNLLPHLHRVRVAKSCGWNKGELAEELIDLAEELDLLDDRNRKFRRGVYAGLSDEEVARVPAGGVWEFEG